jgi:Kef-type K+ transport system membrane component KefB
LKNHTPIVFLCIAALTLLVAPIHAAQQPAPPVSHGDIVVRFLLSIVALLLAAKLGGELLERLGQPAVLGELSAGMILGNAALLGLPFLEPLKHTPGLEMVAQVGVILLLFEVGLESHLKELIEVGLSALVVATVGVIAPTVLGYGVSSVFQSHEGWYVHLFAGATLAATSVGITARVLRDLRKTETKEGRIILGAAVVDDVMGLIILAVVSGMVTSIASGGHAQLSLEPVVLVTVKAILFLAGAVLLGRFVHINALRVGTHFTVPGIPLVLAICYCFALSALAGSIGLAPIVGAFAAGLVLEESDYEVFVQRGEQPIGQLLRPLSTLFVPMFFVYMGLLVDFRSFSSIDVLLFAGALTLVAVIGKQVCALGVMEKGVNRLIVGVGMIPRGEVGLIFTNIGASLAVGGQKVFSPDTVSAMVVMVMLTTVMTPPLLKVLFIREGKKGGK